LSAGAYSLEVVNTITGCTTIYPYAINVENTCEILANGIDDDGDGDTDCDDSEHYAVIRVLDVLRASKQVEDGIIEVEADGQELSFVLEGTYELVLGDIRTLNLENTTGSFTDLPPGHYKLTVINGISMCTTEREIDLYRLEEICGNGLDDNGDGDMDCDDIQCLTEMIEEIQNCDDIECVTEMIEEIQKKNTKMDDDFCFSAEEVDILNLTLERDMRASKRVETVGFIPGEVTGDCGESAYFIAPNGRLIDHSKIHKIHIISPTSPFYKHLKYFVVGIETEEGEYYQAVYSDITIGPTDLIEIRDFKGYYKYDREKKQFDGFLFFRHELEDNIYLDNDQLPADAMAILHPGSKCYLES
jgi:hypothetical protein